VRSSQLHPALHELLRSDPDDLSAIAILADWLEEQGAAAEAEWLSDHLHGMAGLMREHVEPQADLLGAIDPRWLTLQHGLIRTLRVPVGFDRHASRTCQVLSELPLALGLVRAHVPDGHTAAAWMPAMRKWLPGLRALQLGGDVEPNMLEGFDELRMLGLAALPFRWARPITLPALDLLEIDVRGGSLSVLDFLAPVQVSRLELSSASWSEVSPAELERFVLRVQVGSLIMMGRGGFGFEHPLRDSGFELEESADFGEPIRVWRRDGNAPGSPGVYSAS